MPKLTILGTGTSTGVPQIGCRCEVCTSTDRRDARLRTSAVLETDKGNVILFDCGPDFRQQMLGRPFCRLDAVLLTHEHSDHVAGLDDIRPFMVFGRVNVYADEFCVRHLRERIPYCFAENKYPGVPEIALHVIQPEISFDVRGDEVFPFQVFHGRLPILGYRVGSLTYITDMSSYEPSLTDELKGTEILIVNALRKESHPSHQTLEEALAFIGKVNPKQAFLTHLSHHMGLHEVVSRELPDNVQIAFDGVEVRW